jgi:UDP-N-acetylmuramate--alanine ligase
VGALSENVEAIGGLLRDGDLVLTLGAGDVTRLGPQLLDFLAGGART